MNNPTIDSVLKKAREFYEYYPTGGNLHIVLDDGNIEEDHVRWCVDLANNEKDLAAADLGMDLLCLTANDRHTVYCRLHGIPEENEA